MINIHKRAGIAVNRIFHSIFIFIIFTCGCTVADKKISAANTNPSKTPSGEKNLILYYDFDNDASNVICDKSGHNNNGIFSGNQLYTRGISGQAIQFKEKNGVIKIQDSSTFRFPDGMTIMFWIKPSDIDQFKFIDKNKEETIISKNWNWRCRLSSDGMLALTFFERKGTQTDKKFLKPSKQLSKNGWYHIAYVFSPKENIIRLYIDGEIACENKCSGFQLSMENGYPVLLGQDPEGYNHYDGLLDEFKIYNSALSGNDIKDKIIIADGKITEWKACADNIKKGLEHLQEEGKTPECTSYLMNHYMDINNKINQLMKHEPHQISLNEKEEIDNTIQRVQQTLDALNEGIPNFKNIILYTVAPISAAIRTPFQFPENGKITNEIKVISTPGEFEPASFVLEAIEPIEHLSFSVSDLHGPMTIPGKNIDIKVIKCWYQSGHARRNITQDLSRRILVPELLLNDDSLVKVDYEKKENYLKILKDKRSEYIWISRSPRTPKDEDIFAYTKSGGNVPINDFYVEDSPQLLPVSIRKGEYKQFWLTLKTPETAISGIYTGQITVSAGKQILGQLKISLKVLPFKLAAPMTHYDLGKDFALSLYYKGVLTADNHGEITGHYKSEKQLRAELINMKEHGVNNPLCRQLYEFDLDRFEKVLQIRQESGIGGKDLYLGAPANNLSLMVATDPEKLEILAAKVQEIIARAKKYGYQNVFFYGIDEAKGDMLISQIPLWKKIQQAGGKVFVSGTKDNFRAVGTVLDLLICAEKTEKSEAKRWHDAGHKIFSYANPQGGVENPLIYRRNYGLSLWKADYDGASTFIYHWGHGNVWNDFDSPKYRDHNFTYPTANGVIDTIQWEGYREGIDDIRYATTLKLFIQKAKQRRDKKIKEISDEADKYLENIDPQNDNLDIIRLEIIKRIMLLQNAGVKYNE